MRAQLKSGDVRCPGWSSSGLPAQLISNSPRSQDEGCKARIFGSLEDNFSQEND